MSITLSYARKKATLIRSCRTAVDEQESEEKCEMKRCKEGVKEKEKNAHYKDAERHIDKTATTKEKIKDKLRALRDLILFVLGANTQTQWQ